MQAETDSFLEDSFYCSICGTEGKSIDAYVTHMINVESCGMVLKQSSSIPGLLIPRFLFKGSSDLVIGSSVPKSENDVGLQNSYSVIDTGFSMRLKCNYCSLTFSRKAAFYNHCQLQHKNFHVKSFPKSVNGIKDGLQPLNDDKLNIDNENAFLAGGEQHMDNIPAINDTTEKPSCDTCGQVFKSVGNFSRYLSHNYCVFKQGFVCFQEKILKAHISVVHCSTSKFACEVPSCIQIFKTKGAYKRHLLCHTGEKPFKCEICGRCFRESGSLRRHEQSRIHCVAQGVVNPTTEAQVSLKQEVLESDGEGPVTAVVSFDNKLSMNERLRSSKSIDVIKSIKQENYTSASNDYKLIKCKQESAFPVNSEYGVFVEYQNDTEVDASCRSSSFANEENFDTKVELLTLFVCPLCSMSYDKMASLLNHMTVHSSEVDCDCQECSKTFTSFQALARHLLTHASVRQFECCHCSKIFRFGSHAKQHLKAHSNARPFSCHICNRPFKSISARNVHLKLHDNIRPYSCLSCPKSFFTKASLERHIRVHTGDAPFVCLHCGSRFKEHGTLKRHVRTKQPCADQAKLISSDVGLSLLKELNSNQMSPFSSSAADLSDVLSESNFDTTSVLESISSEVTSQPFDIIDL